MCYLGGCWRFVEQGGCGSQQSWWLLLVNTPLGLQITKCHSGVEDGYHGQNRGITRGGEAYILE